MIILLSIGKVRYTLGWPSDPLPPSQATVSLDTSIISKPDILTNILFTNRQKLLEYKKLVNILMFGKNPKRPPEKGDGNILKVQEIFATIQGEGPNAGSPSIFIRLGGCNLACDFCDTEFESFTEKTLAEIVDTTKKLSLNSKNKRTYKLVVITGGEPFRQSIEKLCEELLKENFAIQIETNGTLFREIPKEVEIICSPKNTGNGYGKIRGDLLQRINAFKFLISKNNKDYSEVAEIGQSEFDIPVYIQPLDEIEKSANRENLEYTINMAKEKGYRISLQLHKIMDIP